MSSDTGETPDRLGPGGVVEQQFDVDVHDVQRLLAAHVARIGLEEPLQLRPAPHDRLTPVVVAGSGCSALRYPSAASTARNLRRASNIVLYSALRLDPSRSTSASRGTWLMAIATNTCRCRGVRSCSTARRIAARRSLWRACSSGRLPKRSGIWSQPAASSTVVGRRQKCLPSLVETSRMTNP